MKSKTTTRKPSKKARAGRRAERADGAMTTRAQPNAKIAQALRRAEDELWGLGVPPHQLLQELHESLLLRCLKEANGNYAAAAAMFGPSRQSVQQYANSPLRDARWKPYQQNRRRKRAE